MASEPPDGPLCTSGTLATTSPGRGEPIPEG